MSEKHEDRMASVPLMNLHERRSGSGSSPVNEPDWSDQELEEFSRDPLESVLMQMRLWPQSITRQQCVRASVFSSTISLCVGFAAAFVLLIVLYPPSTCVRFLKEDTTIFSKLLKSVDAETLEVQLRNVTWLPHLAGSPADSKLADYIAQQWLAHGLEDVKSLPYEVQLPQPDKNNPNKVMIIDKTLVQENVIHEAKLDYVLNNSTYIPGFHAYSAVGSVKGDLVFANYGTDDDYFWLQKRVNISGKILLVRHGKIPTYTKVHLAELRKAIGLILYPDPKDFAPHGRRHVFPATTSLPGTAVHSGSLQYTYFPGIQCNDSCSPSIPVQSISYNDAEQFLSYLGGEDAPPLWNGSLPVTYRIGPGFKNSHFQVKLTVGLKIVNATVANVFGKIKGKIEPDRYVIVGSHRDAWGFGGVDPGSGLAVQLQLSQVLGKLLKSGWRPHRTILFCNWGASEYGSSGVSNWIKDHSKVLTERAIVYLNMDMAVQGNFALRVVTVPSLKKLLFLTAEKVPNPDPEETNAGRVSVVETWASRLPDNSSFEADNQLPSIFPPGYNTDYNHFMYTLGVPIVDMSYTFGGIGVIETYPLHHTANDSFQLVSKLVDPQFKYHLAVAQMWAELIRSLSDSVLLPFTITDYAISLNYSCVELHETYRTLSARNRIEFDPLQSAIQNFSLAADTFDQEVKNLDLRNPYAVRSANDRMMLAERAFIIPEGLSCQPNLKHIVWSPDMFTSFKGESFMCLRFYLKKLGSVVSEDKEMYIKMIKDELVLLMSSINSAAFVLRTTV